MLKKQIGKVVSHHVGALSPRLNQRSALVTQSPSWARLSEAGAGHSVFSGTLWGPDRGSEDQPAVLGDWRDSVKAKEPPPCGP